MLVSAVGRQHCLLLFWLVLIGEKGKRAFVVVFVRLGAFAACRCTSDAMLPLLLFLLLPLPLLLLLLLSAAAAASCLFNLCSSLCCCRCCCWPHRHCCRRCCLCVTGQFLMHTSCIYCCCCCCCYVCCLMPGMLHIIQMVRFIILLAQAVPISLYVSLETVKVAQCKVGR